MAATAGFAARYDGWCSRGKHRFCEGDQVHYVDDELVHIDCTPVDEPDPLTPSRTEALCPDCWTYHAGECQ